MDAYADAPAYRAATGDKALSEDAVLNAQLLGMSRLLERSLGLAPGAFNDSVTDRTLTFDGTPGKVLWFRDRSGAHFFQNISTGGIGIDTAGSGVFTGAVTDFTGTYVRGVPENIASSGEPYRGLELLSRSGALVSAWPRYAAAVNVTGRSGWAAVPQVIADLVVHRTHELREGLKSGALEALSTFEGTTPMQPRTFWLWKEAEAMYARRRFVIGSPV